MPFIGKSLHFSSEIFFFFFLFLYCLNVLGTLMWLSTNPSVAFLRIFVFIINKSAHCIPLRTKVCQPTAGPTPNYPQTEANYRSASLKLMFAHNVRSPNRFWFSRPKLSLQISGIQITHDAGLVLIPFLCFICIGSTKLVLSPQNQHARKYSGIWWNFPIFKDNLYKRYMKTFRLWMMSNIQSHDHSNDGEDNSNVDIQA